MDLRPVEAISAVRPVNLKQSADEIAPPFAIDASGRMEEDSYHGAADQQERGLEEEDVEQLSEEEAIPDAAPGEPQNTVDLFA